MVGKWKRKVLCRLNQTYQQCRLGKRAVLFQTLLAGSMVLLPHVSGSAAVRKNFVTELKL